MIIWSATVCSYVSTEQMLLMSSLQSYSHCTTLMSTESKFEHSAACLQLITAEALPPSTSPSTISALLAILHSDTPWQHWQCQQWLIWSRGSGPSAVSSQALLPWKAIAKKAVMGRIGGRSLRVCNQMLIIWLRKNYIHVRTSKKSLFFLLNKCSYDKDYIYFMVHV